ncbi:MAG: TadE/TadG family type IV pilus assembly protein [Paracoccaceae bacterium]
MNKNACLASLKRKLGAFADSRGAVSVEFVLWVPVFILILALTVDATILFKTQANLWTVARDAGRQMSTGLYSNSQAESYAESQFANWGITGTATASQTNDSVTMQISVPVASVTPFRIAGAFTDGAIVAVVTQRKEPN